MYIVCQPELRNLPEEAQYSSVSGRFLLAAQTTRRNTQETWMGYAKDTLSKFFTLEIKDYTDTSLDRHSITQSYLKYL